MYLLRKKNWCSWLVFLIESISHMICTIELSPSDTFHGSYVHFAFQTWVLHQSFRHQTHFTVYMYIFAFQTWVLHQSYRHQTHFTVHMYMFAFQTRASGIRVKRRIIPIILHVHPVRRSRGVSAVAPHAPAAVVRQCSAATSRNTTFLVRS